MVALRFRKSLPDSYFLSSSGVQSPSLIAVGPSSERCIDLLPLPPWGDKWENGRKDYHDGRSVKTLNGQFIEKCLLCWKKIYSMLTPFWRVWLLFLFSLFYSFWNAFVFLGDLPLPVFVFAVESGPPRSSATPFSTVRGMSCKGSILPS